LTDVTYYSSKFLRSSARRFLLEILESGARYFEEI